MLVTKPQTSLLLFYCYSDQGCLFIGEKADEGLSVRLLLIVGETGGMVCGGVDSFGASGLPEILLLWDIGEKILLYLN